MIAIPKSSSLAFAASSRMISRAGVMPPTNGAYEVGSTWSSSQRDPSARSRRRLTDEPAHDVLPADDAAGHVVEALEAEPAALVGAQSRDLVGEELIGQAHARLGGEVLQGVGRHRTGEVQVQVCLGQGHERVRHLPKDSPTTRAHP